MNQRMQGSREEKSDCLANFNDLNRGNYTVDDKSAFEGKESSPVNEHVNLFNYTDDKMQCRVARLSQVWHE